MSWTIRLPWATPPISLNDRGHWRAKAARVKYVRYQVAQLLTMHRVPPAERIHVTLHYVPRDRRRRDADNLVGTLKPCIDAMVDSQIVPDDSPEYVTWSQPIIDPADHSDPHLYLVIRQGETP